MRTRFILYFIILTATLIPHHIGAQAVAIKSNLFGWATTTTNIGAEFGLSRHSTLQVMGYLNPWDFGKDDRHFRFWTVQPEYRYFFCEKFNGHFIGVHALGGEYNAMGINFPLKALVWGNAYDLNPNFDATEHNNGWPNLQGHDLGRHVEGWYIGGGITYGYQWMLNNHWNFEASIGVGYVYSPLRFYGRCQQVIDRRHLNYFGLTNAQLSFLYFF